MLWIALHLPHFVLDTLTPRWRTEAAFVYAGQDKAARTVMSCSPHARQAGVRPGMPLASARGLAPQADAQALKPHRLAERFDALTTLLLPYTPCLVQADAYTLLLEVSASLRLFGGLRALRQALLRTLRPQGLALRLATAPCADGAWLLAVHPGSHIRHTLSPATLARRLHGLHCRYLPAARPYLDWLEGIGCQQLGMLRRLPRADLQRRTGAALLRALDCTYGQAHNTRLCWFMPPDQFHQRLELPAPGTRSDTLIFAAQRLLRPFCLWLDQCKQAATRISLLFEHDARRHAVPCTPLMLQSAQPLWQVEDWLRLLRAHLAHLPLPAPVLALRLQSQTLQARPHASTSLLPAPGGQDSTGYQETLDLLAARLGPEAVRQAAPRPDHRPDAANVWSAPGVPSPVPAQTERFPAQAEQAGAPCAPRPAWLLDTPIALAAPDGLPRHPGPLRLLHGPERIEDGWWSAPMRRDYYVAQDAQGVRYWLFHTEQGEKPGWFLHGLFG